jgi:DNA-directed RNA polymerase specialized sigma24 family protein
MGLGGHYMIDQEFQAASDAIFNRRMKTFRYWTSITPSANKHRKHLSWYLDKRNRPEVAIEQHEREIDTKSAEYPNYSAYLESRSRDGLEDSLGEPRRANPDGLPDTAPTWPVSGNSYQEGQIETARNILDNLGNILTDAEYQVWGLKMTGRMSVNDIAELRGVSAAAVSQMLSRIQAKLKDQYGRLRTQTNDED